MKIVLKKDEVSYESLVKLLFIGHVFGFSILMVPIIILAGLAGLTNQGGRGGSEMLLAVIIVPLILMVQTIFLALLYRLGFWAYGLIKPIQIEVSE